MGLCRKKLHEMSGDNVYRKPDGVGTMCRACARERERRRPRRGNRTDGKTCTVPGCEQPFDAKGFCLSHYRAWRKEQRAGDVRPRPQPVTIVIPKLPGAICLGSDPVLFDDCVDGETDLERNRRHHQAIRICSQCPIRRECLEARGLSKGIWGGVLFSERGGRIPMGVQNRIRTGVN